MRNIKVCIGAQIYYCNHSVTLERSIRKVQSKDPSEILYRDGMVSFRFVDFIEYEENGIIKNKILKYDPIEFFFGEFTSLDDLKQKNVANEWDNAIYNIEGSHGIGMVTSPDGFHSVMPTTGIIINELIPTKKKLR